MRSILSIQEQTEYPARWAMQTASCGPSSGKEKNKKLKQQKRTNRKKTMIMIRKMRKKKLKQKKKNRKKMMMKKKKKMMRRRRRRRRGMEREGAKKQHNCLVEALGKDLVLEEQNLIRVRRNEKVAALDDTS